jgi:hypothetical protein
MIGVTIKPATNAATMLMTLCGDTLTKIEIALKNEIRSKVIDTRRAWFSEN